LRGKFIITRYKGRILTAYAEEHKILQINFDDEDSSILNNIYIGKVKNILLNINAAFIDIGNNQICYYSLDDNQSPIFTKKSGKKKLAKGDELFVQVSKEGVKSKAPVVTSHLNFTGKYVVLTSGKQKLGISTKITDKKWREAIRKTFLQYQNQEYGFIVRTNARNVTPEEIKKECESLIRLYESTKQDGKFRTCYSCVWKAIPSYIAGIRDSYENVLEKIITDDSLLYERIRQYLADYSPKDANKLQLYKDPLLPLAKLYSLDTVIEKALNEKVWLKSGGYLIIQPTEALVVIDVNTGKFTGKKNLQETIMKINLEAAAEISYQIRLRNLSGIIIVDFIDLVRQEDKDYLMKEFDQLLAKDPIKTTLIGLTPLNLAELTRKKIRKPIYEQIK